MNICIVGGGFGGVKTALELAKQGHAITLVSDKTQFQYYPALYRTATGRSHRQSWISLDLIFEGIDNVTILHDSAQSVDAKAKSVRLATGADISYDRLVLAMGTVTSYFGIEGLNTFSYGIKSEAEIRRLQTHLMEEMSDGSDDEAHYVIIGGGPTGVELAGAFAEYVRTLRTMHGIRKRTVNLSLVEAAPRLLPRMSEKASRVATERLKQLGVSVKVSQKVEQQTAHQLIINQKPLTTQTVVWTAGVTNVPFFSHQGELFKLDGRGKVVVDEYMQAAPDIYVIGDNAATPYAGLAQTALHDAQFVARHIAGSSKPYKAVLPPSVVPIGERWALFEWHGYSFAGRAGALLRELADLIGYHDILPIGWAIGSWRSGSKKQAVLPRELES